MFLNLDLFQYYLLPTACTVTKPWDTALERTFVVSLILSVKATRRVGSLFEDAGAAAVAEMAALAPDSGSGSFMFESIGRHAGAAAASVAETASLDPDSGLGSCMIEHVPSHTTGEADLDMLWAGSSSGSREVGSAPASGSASLEFGVRQQSMWGCLGDGYYTQQETEELVEVVIKERREQNQIDAETEVVRKWIE